MAKAHTSSLSHSLLGFGSWLQAVLSSVGKHSCLRKHQVALLGINAGLIRLRLVSNEEGIILYIWFYSRYLKFGVNSRIMCRANSKLLRKFRKAWICREFKTLVKIYEAMGITCKCECVRISCICCKIPKYLVAKYFRNEFPRNFHDAKLVVFFTVYHKLLYVYYSNDAISRLICAETLWGVNCQHGF